MGNLPKGSMKIARAQSTVPVGADGGPVRNGRAGSAGKMPASSSQKSGKFTLDAKTDSRPNAHASLLRG